MSLYINDTIKEFHRFFKGKRQTKMLTGLSGLYRNRKYEFNQNQILSGNIDFEQRCIDVLKFFYYFESYSYLEIIFCITIYVNKNWTRLKSLDLIWNTKINWKFCRVIFHSNSSEKVLKKNYSWLMLENVWHIGWMAFYVFSQKIINLQFFFCFNNKHSIFKTICCQTAWRQGMKFNYSIMLQKLSEYFQYKYGEDNVFVKCRNAYNE